jgi:hypothetical protein
VNRKEILRLRREFDLPMETALRKFKQEDRVLEELDFPIEPHWTVTDETPS